MKIVSAFMFYTNQWSDYVIDWGGGEGLGKTPEKSWESLDVSRCIFSA